MPDAPNRNPLPPPVVALIALIAILGANWLIPALSVSFPGQTLIATILGVSGFAVAGIALKGFFAVGTTFEPHKIDEATALVTGGIYQYTRNPMYLGLVLILAGVTVYMGTALGFLAVAAFIWVITKYQILPEEAALEHTFGDEFRTYKTQVRRWI